MVKAIGNRKVCGFGRLQVSPIPEEIDYHEDFF
jgi:hypothetical protein